MEKHTFKEFNKDLSWSTKLYVLLVICTVGGSLYFGAWNNYWFPTILIAMAVVSLADFLGLLISKNPNVWKYIGWVLLLILMALLFISSIPFF